MLGFVFQENAVLRETARNKLVELTLDDDLISIVAPIDRVAADTIMWEVEDDVQGLMEARTLDAKFPAVTRTGVKEYQVKPSYYGEQMFLTETMLTRGRQIGTAMTPINIDDRVARDSSQMIMRAVDRIRNMIVSFATTGEYWVFYEGQMVLSQKFDLQEFPSSVPLTTAATATPLADLRKIRSDFELGTSSSFGGGAKLLMNLRTANAFLANTNGSDLGRYMSLNGQPSARPLSGPALNAILAENDLPQIVIYNKSYIQNGVAVPHIPDGRGILVGTRPDGEAPNRFTFTANANLLAPDGLGKVDLPKDGSISDFYLDFEMQRNPIKGVLTAALNGGLVPYYLRSMLCWEMF